MSALPQPVAGALTFTAITTGSRSSCAITATGAAYCWGSNDGGQLGTAATELCNGAPCSHTPVAISGALLFSQMSLGDQHGCGLTTLGKLFCWGKNDAGQLGDGTLTDRPAPTRVAGQP